MEQDGGNFGQTIAIPSNWAFYVAMVSAVTRESSRFILYHMAYARGLQYQVVYWRLFFNPKLGQNCEKLVYQDGIKVVI